jgi:hypothetical protein
MNVNGREYVERDYHIARMDELNAALRSAREQRDLAAEENLKAQAELKKLKALKAENRTLATTESSKVPQWEARYIYGHGWHVSLGEASFATKDQVTAETIAADRNASLAAQS